jgi:hypothetical protein
MTKRRWVRLAVVTTIAVGATLAATAAPAQAMPKQCKVWLDAVDNDWNQVNEWANWALIAKHDGDWQDYEEDMQAVSFWAMQAKIDTRNAQRGGCY